MNTKLVLSLLLVAGFAWGSGKEERKASNSVALTSQVPALPANNVKRRWSVPSKQEHSALALKLAGVKSQTDNEKLRQESKRQTVEPQGSEKKQPTQQANQSLVSSDVLHKVYVKNGDIRIMLSECQRELWTQQYNHQYFCWLLSGMNGTFSSPEKIDERPKPSIPADIQSQLVDIYEKDTEEMLREIARLQKACVPFLESNPELKQNWLKSLEMSKRHG